MTEQGKEIDLANWPVAILAGGLATRLRPQTDKIPKALLTVAGEPFLLHQLRLLRANGFRKIVLCVGYLGEMIEAQIGDGSDIDLQITYSFDGPDLLGTGGALKRALPNLGDKFVVIYGDSYMPVDYGAIVEAFIRSSKPALMTVLKNEGRWDTSNVQFEEGAIHRYDKRLRTTEMRYIDYGIAVLSATVLESVPGDVPFDLADLYSRLVSGQQMAAYEVKERFYEIGSRHGLAELDSLLRGKAAIISP
ncbi:MAG TPA: nucleotidyltransferase family protein [Candidatus Udaeobacter sp.]|jgi:NDP-sugar pyrophosphorylase family protein|nr:nucleotidyltransferase family protein [Candidatus Udaeobacter sp.]